MNKVLLIVLLMASAQVALSQTNKVKTIDIKTEISCDHCAQCGSCGQNIFMKVKANTKGVRSIKVDSKKNIVTVKYNSEKTNLEEIEKAITIAGYKANEREPSTEAYEKLDGCCKNK